MDLPSHLAPLWDRARAAFPEARFERSPVAKLAGSAFPDWLLVAREPFRMALRATPEALELWAGEIEDASSCVLERSGGEDPGTRMLAKALGPGHPLTGAFALRFVDPGADTCWPARALLAAAPALGSLGTLATALDLYPAGLHAKLPWSGVSSGTLARAMAACGEYLAALEGSLEDLDPYLEAQEVLEEPEAGEAGAGEAADGSMPPVRGFKPRFPRGLLDALPPLALKWTAGISLPLAFFAGAAVLGTLVPRWGSRSATDSPLATAIFAVVAGGLGFEALRRLARDRRPPADPRPPGTRGPITEDWKRDFLLLAAPGLVLLALAFGIASPSARESSDAPCFNVGLGLAGGMWGIHLLLRSFAVLWRVLRCGPALLWIAPDPPRPGEPLRFRVRIPGTAPLPGLHATLRCARTRLVGTQSVQFVPLVHYCRSLALLPAEAGDARTFEGALRLPSAEESPAARDLRNTWELTVHGARPRRHPDLCFIMPGTSSAADPES